MRPLLGYLFAHVLIKRVFLHVMVLSSQVIDAVLCLAEVVVPEES